MRRYHVLGRKTLGAIPSSGSMEANTTHKQQQTEVGKDGISDSDDDDPPKTHKNNAANDTKLCVESIVCSCVRVLSLVRDISMMSSLFRLCRVCGRQDATTGASWAATRHQLPPLWVDKVDGVEEDVRLIQLKRESEAKNHHALFMLLLLLLLLFVLSSPVEATSALIASLFLSCPTGKNRNQCSHAIMRTSADQMKYPVESHRGKPGYHRLHVYDRRLFFLLTSQQRERVGVCG